MWPGAGMQFVKFHCQSHSGSTTPGLDGHSGSPSDGSWMSRSSPQRMFRSVEPEVQTLSETCSSERAGVGAGVIAGDSAAAGGGGVISLSSFPGQLCVLTPRFRVPARGGPLACRAPCSARGMLTGQERVRA